MGRILKATGFVLLALAILLSAFIALAYTPALDPVYLTQKYGGERARFVPMANGQFVHYRDQGNPEGPAIILVHGSTSSLHAWEPWVGALGERYRLISYDQPGHGLTGPAPDGDYSAEAMGRALGAVADAAGVRRFALAGNSMGGWVAWRYALAEPERVEALILIDAAGLPAEPGARRPVGFALMASPVGRLLTHVTPRWLIALTARQSVYVKEIVTEEYVERYWELLRYPGNRAATLDRLATGREPAMAAERLSGLEVPTLILWGVHDSLIDVAAASRFDDALPNSRLIIYDDAGHLPMEEIPEKSAADTDTFLSEVLSQGEPARP